MNTSFVFYKSFFDSMEKLPTDEERVTYFRALCNLAFYEIETDLTDASLYVQMLYTVTSEQVKASIQHKIDGAKGGKQKGINAYNKKNTPLNTPLNTNVNVNVNDNVNVNANVNTVPDSTTPAIKNYSNIIFELFSNAGLPCAKNNPVSFLMQDFNNALRYLHTTDDYKHIHSDDVIEAVKNYITVLNSPDSYVTQKMNFLQLVKSKLFYQLLPSNFDFENFRKFEKEEGVKPGTTSPKKRIHFYNCPECNKPMLYTDEEKSKKSFEFIYTCKACGFTDEGPNIKKRGFSLDTVRIEEV